MIAKWFRMPLSLRFGLGLILGLASFAVVAVVRGGNATLIVGKERLQWPSAAHWFGTDELGRDLLARTINGLWLSFVLAAATIALVALMAVPLGLVAGWLRGRAHDLTARILDVALAVPPLLFVLIVVTIIGFGLGKMMLAVAIIFVPSVARVVRSETLRLREQDFVEAALARGENTWHLLRHELLPNVLPLIVVELTFRFGLVVTMVGALSFLGLGVQPPDADLGLMIAEAKQYLPTLPTMVLLPGAMMTGLILPANLLGDGLRDFLDTGGRG